jgi:transcriptional regulator with XRE-family HTH domain
MMVKDKLAPRNRAIGALLRNSRKRATKTKRECAAVLGVSTGRITAYEEGRRSISLPEIEVLAYALGTPMRQFLEVEPEPTIEEEQPPLREVLALRHRIVGALLRQARTEADISQKELAKLAGVSASRFSSYEYGERPMPLAELELVAEHLGLPLAHFLDDQKGPVGKWHQREETWRRFGELSTDVQDFVIQPDNMKYVEVAMRLAHMPAGGLRAIAEGLLDITE